MALQILFHTIMTDARSKSNIAAKFQHALTLQYLPPIGVFWDIENCQVPKGKSALALVQSIRDAFFTDHREAEFMCVCDIHKENNAVINELLLAQITVVHISATSKNAADDKLKQCMRRFVDTHGAPATLLLISDDINFATDLSDFRHRHNIRIILIHRGRAHESLIACAHEHYDFSIVTGSLPSRNPMKASDSRPRELEVNDLPTDKKESLIHNRLKRLSDNCGGKVLSVKGSKAVILFPTPDAAERAQKRMDNEDVCGNKISVSLLNSAIDFSSPLRSQFRSSSYEASVSSNSSRNSSVSPPRRSRESRMKPSSNFNPKKQFNFPPPPLLTSQNRPTLLRQVASMEQLSTSAPNLRTYRPPGLAKENGQDPNRSYSTNVHRYSNISAFLPFRKDMCTKDRCNPSGIDRVSPFILPDCDTKPNQAGSSNARVDVGRRNLSHCSDTFSSRLNSYQSRSSNPSLNFNDIRRISEPVMYSSQWHSGSPLSHVESLPVLHRNPPDISPPVELYVSNLDQSFEVNEMKKILQSVFREHVMVLHISMSLQPDGSARAIIKVPSLQDAQYAISQLHRRKIGHKRILISHTTTDKNPPFHVLRYHRSIAVSELYKMRDAVHIHGDVTGRSISLNPDYSRTPSLADSEESQDLTVIERPYCERHFRVSDSQGWAEQYSVCPLPLVFISLKTLSTAVHTLLETHQGSLPLISFCACYEAEIGSLPIVGSFESLSERENTIDYVPTRDNAPSSKATKGVPLEHLITCVAGVEVAKSQLSIKKVQWSENKAQDMQGAPTLNPVLAGQVNLFGREIMDLLKSQSQCLVPFNKFIPTYHHHFGRQCRVADYGFTKLIDLLEAMPHIVQVLGEGQNRQVTLTHRTQVKRFTAELLRILKSRASKQITLSEFPQAYEQTIEKQFEITNYGVCEVEDMLDEVSENTIVRFIQDNEITIGIPKREQTGEEIERTKEFSIEVVELLRHTPLCSMAFNKFIPSYHHHFGKQCRVADYGFTKLIELFEAIPDILVVTGTGEDKILNLVPNMQQKILSERIVSILRNQPNNIIDMNSLSAAYSKMYGQALRPLDFGFTNMKELIHKVDSISLDSILVVSDCDKTSVILIDYIFLCQLSQRCCQILMEQKEGKLACKDFNRLYQMRFGQHIDIQPYGKVLEKTITVEDGFVNLVPLQMLARHMIMLLQSHGNQFLFSSFSSNFQKRFGYSICTAKYGFGNMNSLLEALSDYFFTKGRKQKRVIYLNTDIIKFRLPQFPADACKAKENTDILNQPIPSCVPSPYLEPEVKTGDLMGFETPPDYEMKKTLECDKTAYAPTTSKKTTLDSAVPLKNQQLLPQYTMHHHHQCSALPASRHSAFAHRLSSTALHCQSPTGQVRTVDAMHQPVVYQRPATAQVHSVITNPKVQPIIEPMDISSGEAAEGVPNHSMKSKLDSLSLENLSSECKREDTSSSKSTPTRAARLSKSRIAAQFSFPTIN